MFGEYSTSYIIVILLKTLGSITYFTQVAGAELILQGEKVAEKILVLLYN